MDEMKTKMELIEKFLTKEGYSLEERKGDDIMEIEAQSLVMRLGLNRLSANELQEFLGKN